MKFFRQLAYLTSLLIILLMSNNIFADNTITLDGRHLNFNELISVSRQHSLVKIDPEAYERVKHSYQILLLAAQQNFPIYGLNHGVGQNKDKTIFEGSVIKPQARLLSQQFNKNILYAHSAGFGAEAPIDTVRAAMLIRLNTFLLGNAGVQTDVVLMYRDFLNKDITPILPCCGSMGEADITILSHIGLAMIGEGQVYFRGKKMPAKQALKLAKLKPLQPFAKDALAIISSNAYSAGVAVLTAKDTEELINKYDLTLALSLEALNGNVAPYLAAVQNLRPYPGQIESSKKILHDLQDSYLWQTSNDRALQDPLSFRTGSQVDGAARDILKSLEQKLLIQINSSDDNPAVIVDPPLNKHLTPQENVYYVHNEKLAGAIIPTANFEPINWVLDVEELGIAVSHLANSSAQRIVKLGAVNFTNLPRFLSPNQTTLAYSAIQKPVMSLNTEIHQLSNPVSAISFPVAGDIEDVATNAPLAVFELKKMNNDLYRILGIELIHANQAIDLRKNKNKNLQLGMATDYFHKQFRKVIPYLSQDRVLTDDIQKAYDFIIAFNLNNI